MRTANAMMSRTLPALCNHLLTPSPSTPSPIIAPIKTQLTPVMNNLLLAIQGIANAYDKLVAIRRPMLEISTTAYIQRFQATMKPAASPNPSFVH